MWSSPMLPRSTFDRYRGETDSARNPRASITRFSLSSSASASPASSSPGVEDETVDVLLA